MASGIKISDEVKEYCQKVTMNKAGQQKLQFAILTFSADNKAVVVESSGTQEEAKPYDEIIKALPANDVRYLIVDFPYVNKDGVSKSEVILISWHPPTASIRKKMVCASTLNALKSALSMGKNVYEGDTLNEIDSSAINDKIGGKKL